MKKITSLVIALTLIFTSVSQIQAQEVISKNTKTSTQFFSSPINSIETGDEVGLKSYEVVTTQKNDEVIINTKITTQNYATGEKDVKYDKSTITYKSDKIISINGEEINGIEQEKIASLSKNDQEKIQPLAEKLKLDIINYDEYVEEIRNLDLDMVKDIDQNDLVSSMARGGLSWITHYSKNSNGKYTLKAGKMKGYTTGGLNSFMLDPKAAVSGSIITRTNTLTSNQGGLVSSFINKADSISSARAELAIEAAALMGLLGVAVLTVPTILGAITASGSAALVAARMYSVSSGAHTDIKNAYEYARAIKNI